MPNLVGEKDRMRKASMGKTKVSVRKTNRFLGEQTGDKKVVIRFVYAGVRDLSIISMAMELF